MPKKTIWITALILAVLAGCRGLPDRADPTALPEDTPTPLAIEPTVPAPTPVPTSPPPLVVLLAPEGADPDLQGALKALISETAARRGLRWQLRQTMTPEEVAAEADYLITLPPAEGLGALVAAAPGTAFLAIGVAGLEPAGNLILVSAQTISEEIEAFMGGYIGALLTADWRVGIITTEDEFELPRFAAFENGMRFFCGLCRPQYAPFYEYPFLLSLPDSAGEAEWGALADFMRDRLTGTVYVSPGAGGPDLIAALASLEINVIGGTKPPPGLEGVWVASLRVDPLAAYLEYIPRLLDGELGISTTLPLQILDVNPELLSSGKLRLAENTLADLIAGYILPGEPTGP